MRYHQRKISYIEVKVYVNTFYD